MEKSIDTLQTQWTGLSRYVETAIGHAIAWGPKLVAALFVLLLAYLIARGLSYATQYGVDKTRFGKQSVESGEGLGEVLGRAVFWVVILIALPAVLATLGLSGLVEPMQNMADRFLAFLPNLVGAGLIFGIGWAVASVLKRTVTSVLEAAQTDQLAERAGLAQVTGETGISRFLGTLAFTLLIIPVAIAALDTLSIESISGPAKAMLGSFLDAIPNIFAAAVILLLAYLIGKFASDTLAALLPPLGFDRVGERVGLTEEVFTNTSLSAVTGYIAFAAIMIFGMIEAAKILDFEIVSQMLAHVLALGGQILLGSVIIAFGVVAADFVYSLVEKSKDARPVAGFLKVAIIVLAVAMGLRQMGVANEIINVGFTLLIGALALGAAIAIGWGGKETAGRLLEKWTKNL